MRKALLTLVLALLAPMAQAQTPATSQAPAPIDVPALLSGIKMDIGVGYDVKNNEWTQTDTVRMLEYAKTDNSGKYATFLNYVGAVNPSANIGYSSSDKLVVGVALNLVTPAMFGLTSPLLQYVAIRPFANYSFYHLGSNVTNIKNSWIFGATFVKGQF